MANLNLCPLRSSSKGNTTMVFNKDTRILVDCGISGKALIECLSLAGVEANTIDALVITHEHSDHIKGVGIISRKYDIPIYANKSTWQAMKAQLGRINEENIRVFETGSEFYINSIKVKSFKTPHDAAESVGYTFSFMEESVAVATDMGVITEEILAAIYGSHTALIEANYDLNMLEIGSYPYELKCRIKGERGHLCNSAAAELARSLADSGTKRIILGHLSEENNYPPIAFETVKACIKDCEAELLVVGKGGSISKY